MAPKRRPTPSYLLHVTSGRARAVWTDHLGRRHDRLLPGPFGSSESKTAYGRLLLELEVGPQPADTGPRSGLTLNELSLAFLTYAGRHYRGADGRHTSEYAEYKLVARKLRELYGDTAAGEFGPLKLRAVREGWVADGLARTEVNRRVRRVKRLFRWAVAEELIGPAVLAAIGAVTGLQKGRTAARETEPVAPVDPAAVAATLPHVRSPVAGMIRVQMLTGMRPQDVCRLRPCDLDRSGPVWVYRPPEHKNSHRGKDRAVAIGPKAQAVLAGFEPADPAGCYFNPRRATAERNAERAAGRKTPRWPSHQKRNARKKKAAPKRAPAARYTTHAYGVAVARGVERANARRGRLAAGGAFDPVPHWQPNQLRHLYATEVRKRYGLEAAQVALGHERADVTQIYAQKNLDLAARVAGEIG